MHSEVIQLDSDSMRPQHNVMLILLSDRLLIGQPSSGYKLKIIIFHTDLVCEISLREITNLYFRP